MHTENSIQEYLKTAGEQIRWERARKPLLYELETHILDRRDALIRQGIDEHEAESAAVSEMGDPEAAGLELDRIHRPKPNWFLLGGAAALLILGMTLLYLVGGKSEQFSHMLILSGLGFIFLIVGYFCDYTFLVRFAVPIFTSFCCSCIIPPLTENVSMNITSQLCYILPLAFAGIVYSLKTPLKPYILSGTSLLILWVSMLSHNPASMFVYLFTVCGVILIYAASKNIISTNKFKAWLPAGSFFALFILISVFAFTDSRSELWHRFIKGALDPEADPYAGGWVSLRVRELIGTSALVGAGETSEYSKTFMSSSDFSLKDFTLAVASHKFGLLIFIAVILLLAFLTAVVIIGTRKQHCHLSKLILLTVGLSFALRITAYIACNLGFVLFSLDGIPLFSYNGKLMIPDMFALGLMLSVFRTESIARDSFSDRSPLLRT